MNSDQIPEKPSKDEPVLSMESVSAVFAHDVSTPLTTAQLNAKLLIEYINVLKTGLNSEQANAIPSHIKQAIERSPQLISQNIALIQKSLADYKAYLNSVHADEDAYQITERSPGEQFGLERLKILLVDDEAIHHDIGDVVLGNQHELSHEHGGEAAIERCKQEEFEVILMDIKMPNLSGQETVEQLRKFVPQSTIILGLTNMPIEERRPKLHRQGFDNFLDKPLKLSAFNKLIEALR